MGWNHRPSRTGTRTSEGTGILGVWRGFNGFGEDDTVLGLKTGPEGSSARLTHHLHFTIHSIQNIATCKHRMKRFAEIIGNFKKTPRHIHC